MSRAHARHKHIPADQSAGNHEARRFDTIRNDAVG